MLCWWWCCNGHDKIVYRLKDLFKVFVKRLAVENWSVPVRYLEPPECPTGAAPPGSGRRCKLLGPYNVPHLPSNADIILWTTSSKNREATWR